MYWKYQQVSDRIYRVVDLVGMCAVDLILPYRDIHYYSGRRAVFALSFGINVNHLGEPIPNRLSSCRDHLGRRAYFR